VTKRESQAAEYARERDFPTSDKPASWAVVANGRIVETHATFDGAMFAVQIRESRMAMIEGVPINADGSVGDHAVIPLYRQLPNHGRTTLTHEEREAVASAVAAYELDDDSEECERIASVLRGLLERTK
jgi:hypothetical protein